MNFRNLLRDLRCQFCDMTALVVAYLRKLLVNKSGPVRPWSGPYERRERIARNRTE
jgi:hypothetical protein